MRCIIHSKLKFTAHSLRCFSSSQKPLVFGSPVFLYAFGFSLSVLHAFFLARRSAAVLRLRHAQPEQRRVVRTLCKYRTQLCTEQSHHAERSTEAAKQNRCISANARTPQSSPLRGRLGGRGNRNPRVFGSFDSKRTSPSFAPERASPRCSSVWF